MDSAMEDAAPFEESRTTGTSQEQQIIVREIADSDAESGDDAIDIDDEKPKASPGVATTVADSMEQPEEIVESNAPLQVEETGPLSIDSPAVVYPDTPWASTEIEMDINDNLVNKSLEQSEEEIERLSANEVEDTGSSAIEAPDPPLMADNEPKIQAIEIVESVEQTKDTPESRTQPAQTTTSDQLIEEPRLDERPRLSLAETSFSSTLLESSNVFKRPAEAEDTVTKVSNDLDSNDDASTSPVLAQFAHTTTSDKSMISSDGLNEGTRGHESPKLPLAETASMESLASAHHADPEAPAEDKNHILDTSQRPVENIPTLSIPAQPTQVHTSDAPDKNSKQEATPESSQVELTPEQKRIASLQSRSTSLTNTLTSLSTQRTALLHSLSTHLSPYTLADIPSVLKPYKKTTYTPSTASHTTPLPSIITPEDDAKLMAEARQVIKDHIGRLHRYNEIRDVGQGLIGIIAEQRGARIVDCMDEFGVKVGD